MKLSLGTNPEQTLIIAAVVLVVGYIAIRGFSGAAKDVTKAAVDTATGAVAGVVVGAGEAVGIPDTSQTQCEIDIANKDYWNASFHCDAGRFLRFAATGK